MSDICAGIIIALLLLVLPVLVITIIVRLFMKKRVRKLVISALICAVSIIPLALLGAYTDPATWCEHEYSIVSERASTCVEKGEIVKKCSKCERENVKRLAKISHEYVEVAKIVPTCLEKGKIVYSCTSCKAEKTDTVNKLGHDMRDTDKGSRCSVCGYEKVDKSDKKSASTDKSNTKQTKSSKNKEDAKETTYIKGVGFEEIYRAYKENELVAEEAYQYNRYRITAKINGMSTGGLFNITGGATLTMEKRVGDTIVFFYAEFEKAQEDNLKKIKVGDTITFEGECLSAGSWVDCELILE